jgi:hypothetical protein
MPVGEFCVVKSGKIQVFTHIREIPSLQDMYLYFTINLTTLLFVFGGC